MSLKKRASMIRLGIPIKTLDLTFYPITMEHYEEFLECKDVLGLRMTTLPVKYFSKDYASGIFLFDMDSIRNTGKNTGLFLRFLRMVYLSLRIEIDLKKVEIKVKQENGEQVLDGVWFNQCDKRVFITSNQLSFQIRSLIAQQNGIELPDESENIDLIRDYAEQQKQKNGNVNLNVDIGDLIASVAYLSGKTEREVNDWTVLEFERRKRAIDRDKLYMLYAQAELGGMVKFKNGNPVPSWCYDVIDDSLGTQSLSQLQFGGAKQKTD